MAIHADVGGGNCWHDPRRSKNRERNLPCSSRQPTAVNGAPSLADALHVAHVENKGSVSDNKVWVSGGKILKTEVQIQGGPHMVTVLDYANVAPPAGATPIGPPPQH